MILRIVSAFHGARLVWPWLAWLGALYLHVSDGQLDETDFTQLTGRLRALLIERGILRDPRRTRSVRNHHPYSGPTDPPT